MTFKRTRWCTVMATLFLAAFGAECVVALALALGVIR